MADQISEVTGVSSARPDWALSVEDRGQPAGRVFALSLERALARHRIREQLLRIERSPRALHRYRVSLRKARSVLAAGRDVFPAEELHLLDALMGTQSSISSTARDLDVFVEQLEEMTEPLPRELHQAAREIRDVLLTRRDLARREVLESLDGEANAAMMRRWLVMASVFRVGGGEPGPLALRPIEDVVGDALWRAFKRLRRRGRAALRSGEPADWHRARKAAKRLRYELAAFRGLYSDDDLQPLRSALRNLQEAFGELQDEVVRIDLLRSAAQDASVDAALAAGALIDRQLAKQPDALDRCAQAWTALDTKDQRRQLKSALGR